MHVNEGEALFLSLLAARGGDNVLLGGGANLMRDPRNGRTLEYLSEDPLLTGTLVGASIASVLFGETNPSGRLPITFPAGEAQLPRPKVDGFGVIETNIAGSVRPKDFTLFADYNIEGSDVGYRWNARERKEALFPFGYGLSYTTFASSGLKMSGLTASFSVANTGKRNGATVAQLYLVSRVGAAKQRLVGYSRVSLAAGASEKVTLIIDPRLLADWKDGGSAMAAGDYGFAQGDNAETLGPVVKVRVNARRWKD